MAKHTMTIRLGETSEVNYNLRDLVDLVIQAINRACKTRYETAQRELEEAREVVSSYGRQLHQAATDRVAASLTGAGFKPSINEHSPHTLYFTDGEVTIRANVDISVYDAE